MRHFAVVVALVAAMALAWFQDSAIAAPTQPTPNTIALGPGATTGTSTGTMAVQNTGDASQCMTLDPTTGKYVTDPTTGYAIVLAAVCDEIRVTLTQPGTVSLCVSYTDLDPLHLGQLDLDAAIYDPASDQFLARADSLNTVPECLTFTSSAPGTFQALVVPFTSISSTYTASFTWSAPVGPPSQPAVPDFQMNGGGKIPAGAVGEAGDASFSLLARTSTSNPGKFSFRLNNVCSFIGQVTNPGSPTPFGTGQGGNGNNNGGSVDGITGSGTLNNQSVTFVINDASDFGEGNPKQDLISSVQFTGGSIPASCTVNSQPLKSGNLQFHLKVTT